MMGETQGADKEKAAFLRAAEAMYEELEAWRARHPEASFDEIAAQVTPRRQALLGPLLAQLAARADEHVEPPRCETCGQSMRYKGTPQRQVAHREGEAALSRAYWYCDSCNQGLFPPGPSAATEQASLESADNAAGAAAGGRDPLASPGG
jgi:hypothetical protein